MLEKHLGYLSSEYKKRKTALNSALGEALDETVTYRHVEPKYLFHSAASRGELTPTIEV